MFPEISERSAQPHEGLPTVVAADSAPGETGVFVCSARLHRGEPVSAIPRPHDIRLDDKVLDRIRDYVAAQMRERIEPLRWPGLHV